MSDIIIGGLVLLVVLVIVVKQIQHHKKGDSGCGCGHCNGNDHKA